MNGKGLSWYDKVVKMAECGQAKKHVFCGEGTVAGTGCKTLACALEVLRLPFQGFNRFFAKNLNANG